ncbi:hypothetical protein QBZ16_002804 [Prototheca wickerhamii]|uniref:F-box domain-containing protein n=1 Tax=Prototheca wickerhamii TaxID=3111 RepID=A0AAD9IIG1_PROWI|nr:hypothetical protein QBZ16_002804 [Prototheca wickerhamii]
MPQRLHISSLDDASLLHIFSHLGGWWDRMRGAQVCRRWRDLLQGPASREQWREVQVRLLFGGQEEIWTNQQMRALLDFFQARRDWFGQLSLVLDMETDLAEDGVLCVSLLFGLLGLIGSSLSHLELVVCEPPPDQKYYDEQDRRQQAGLPFDDTDPWEYTARESARGPGVNLTALMDNCAYFSLIPNVTCLAIRGERFPQPWFLPPRVEQLALDGGQRAADALTMPSQRDEHETSAVLLGLRSLELPEFCLHLQHASTLATLRQLRRLCLGRVHFHAPLPRAAEDGPVFPDLEELDLSETSAAAGLHYGDCIAFVRGCPRVRWLSLRGCGLDAVPDCVTELPLQTLHLGGNRLGAASFLPPGPYLDTLRVLGLSSTEAFGAKNKYPPEDGEDFPNSSASGGSDSDEWYTDDGGDNDEDAELSADSASATHSEDDRSPTRGNWSADEDEEDAMAWNGRGAGRGEPSGRDGAAPRRGRRDGGREGRGKADARVIPSRDERERQAHARLFRSVAESLRGVASRLETLRINLNPWLLYTPETMRELVEDKPCLRRLEVSSSFWKSEEEIETVRKAYPRLRIVEV